MRNATLLNAIKSGNWITYERVRGYSIILSVCYAILVLYMVAMSTGGLDFKGRPLGTDYSNVYAAGIMALAGNPEQVYNYKKHYQTQREVFGAKDVPFYGWHYPPIFLLVAAVLALMPYSLSLFVWQFVTLALYLLTIVHIAKRYTSHSHIILLAALAFPAVFINIGHGHTGFLCAALLGVAFLCWSKKPFLSGLCLGLLAFKPQFGLLIPLALLVSGSWRIFAAATITVLTLCAFTFIVFGQETWVAFFESMHVTRTYVLETGATGWHKIQSLFAAIRMWGGSIEVAYIFQGLGLTALGITTVALWRSKTAHELKVAALMTACLLSTPYLLDYDLMILAPALALVSLYGFKNGFLPFEKTLLAAIWLTPLLTRFLADTFGLPLGLIMMSAFYILIMRRAYVESKSTFIEKWTCTAQARGGL